MAIFQAIQVLLIVLISPILSHPTEAEAQVGPNIIHNGGFETGKLAPWSFVRVYPRVHDLYKITKPGLDASGKYKFEYDANTVYDPEYEGPEAGFGILQNITTVKGAAYTISFKYLNQPQGDSGETSTKLYVEAGAADWRLIYAPKNKITTFKRTFNASDSKILIGIYFYCNPYYSYDSSQHSQIDNVQVRKM